MIEMPTEPSAKVVADSISPAGDRLISVQATGHRFILAEVNTHSVLVRSSASSRAIPLSKQLAKVREDAAVPVIWASEQKGMQGGEELPDHLSAEADRIWYDAAESALEHASDLGDLKVHKSIANRILEPFMWHTMLITGTAWQNMFDQRVHPDAQPEFQAMATAIKEAIDASEPQELRTNQWHLPYIEFGEDDYAAASLLQEEYPSPAEISSILVKVSVARCARNSYLTQDGKRDIALDLDLYGKLTTERFEKGDVPHWTPLEHVATPWASNRQPGTLDYYKDGVEHRIDLSHLPRVGRLLGWMSHRHLVEAQQGVVTFR